MSKVLLTKKGFVRLRKEFDELNFMERPKVVAGVANAAAEGDRSENAEYIYGKKRLREIDKRLQYLSKLLKSPLVFDRLMVSTDIVGFGSRVTVVNEEGERKRWTIVGDGEAELKEQTISVRAPVATALLGKAVGDVVEVQLQKGLVELEIVAIEVGEIE